MTKIFSLKQSTRWMLITVLIAAHVLYAQEIREYTVKRTAEPLLIDGRLSEDSWQAAALTERFVIYYNGAETVLSTRAKFLWDDTYLYVGFICEDPDVWATMTGRDDHLWNGEVVEILCDPDGDGLNYFEVQVNPLGTILDLLMNKAYYLGGSADLSWNLDSIKAGVWVDGTLNDPGDVDVQWQCEVALPFAELAFMGPGLHFPPIDGEAWRILVTRYDYGRSGDTVLPPEVSSWNQTQSQGGFHVPHKFGRIIFSEELVVSLDETDWSGIPEGAVLHGNYPNPFNARTTIRFGLTRSAEVRVSVYNLLGQQITILRDGWLNAGEHRLAFDAAALPGGVYYYRVQTGDGAGLSGKMVLLP